jgi:glycosyltransferase involved in cell wall biosynthesis
MLLKRFAIVSHILPPSPSGQAVVLYRLLQDIPAEDYSLLSVENYEQVEGNRASHKLPATYYRLRRNVPLGAHYVRPPFKTTNRVNYLLGRVYSKVASYLVLAKWGVALVIETYRRARQIYQILSQDPARMLMATTGEPFDLPGAYLAARWLHIPFVPYLFDDYAYQWTGLLRRFSSPIERFVLKRATQIIVTNEFTAKEYSRRYGVKSTVIHNLCPIPELVPRDREWLSSKTINIVYMGSIYHAHFDAFRNLIAALASLNRPDRNERICLHVFTNQPQAFIAQEGVCGEDVIYHEHVSQEEVPLRLQQADFLFLPLAFQSAIPEVLRTASPGKMGEYLASGRPILVHAPADTFVSDYFRQHECGLVVDQNDAALLAQALHELINDKALQIKMAQNARQQAQADFALERVRRQFVNFVDSLG